MPVDVAPVPRPEWSALPHEGAVGVEGKVLLRSDDVFVAMLRFSEDATIHEHPAPHEIVAICLEGEGFTSVGGERTAIRAGQRVVWPKDVPHRLWTEGSTMTTLMVERPASQS